MLWRNFVHRTCVLDDWGLLVLMLMIWSGCLHATLLLIGWCPFLRGRLPVCGAAGVSLLLYMDVVRLYLGLKRGGVSAGDAPVVCVAKAREFAGVETKAQ